MSDLRIGVDAWGLSGPLLYTGMGQCAALLLRAMPDIAPTYELIAYAGPGEERPAWLPASVTWRPTGEGTSRLTAIRSRLRDIPRVATEDGLDVFHAPAVHVRPSLPPVPATPCPLVVTIHDAIPISHYGRDLPMRLRAFYRWNLARALRATVVLTGTRSARHEIATATGCDPGVISVVPPGIDLVPNASRECLDRLGVRPPYLLVAGSFEPRKNLVGALRAFASISHDVPYDVIAVVDAGSGHAASVLPVPARLGIEDRVRFVDSVPDADLRALYSHAQALVFLSFAEGFGLPPLQAAACDVPVVASDLPVLREVMEGGAVFVDPRDDADVSAGLRAVLEDEALRARLIAAGRARVASFTPRRWVEGHVAAYERAAATVGRREPAP